MTTFVTLILSSTTRAVESGSGTTTDIAACVGTERARRGPRGAIDLPARQGPRRRASPAAPLCPAAEAGRINPRRNKTGRLLWVECQLSAETRAGGTVLAYRPDGTLLLSTFLRAAPCRNPAAAAVVPIGTTSQRLVNVDRPGWVNASTSQRNTLWGLT